MKRRPGSRFLPTELGLVRRYLRNMVERNVSDNIKTIDVYKDDPWCLDHVSNSLFRKNEWYYFVSRTKRGTKSTNRIVPKRGENEGGTWKTTGSTEPIRDSNGQVFGYRQSLVYNKKVNGMPVKTNWLMTEYSLRKDNEFQGLVLCWIRYKKDKKLNLGFDDAPQIVEEDQPLEHEDHAPVLALPPQIDNNDMMNSMLPLPYPQGQDSGLETMNESNNVLMPSYDNNYLIHGNNYLMEGYDNNYYLMEGYGNNYLMEGYDNNSLTHDNNVLIEGYDNNSLTLTQSNDNNYLMHDNNVLMEGYDNNYLMHDNNVLMEGYDDNNYLKLMHDEILLMPMSNDEQNRFDDFDLGDFEDRMYFDIDELMGPSTCDYTQQQQDQLTPLTDPPQVTGHETFVS